MVFASGMLFSFAIAQNAVTISGVLRDGKFGDTLRYAAVTVLDLPDSATVAGALSDENGAFTVNMQGRGEHLLVVRYLGYLPLQRPIFIGEKNDTYDLGTLRLQPDLALDAVEIEAERATVDAALDKKAFAMDDQIARNGGSLLDALQALPGITVDPEGVLELRGSDQVAILIDGKQSSLTGFGNQKGLDNIPASSIERIEIINNPSAKYDAVGMAGVINIVYKKEDQKGLHGDVGLSLGAGRFGLGKADLPSALGSYRYNPKVIPSVSLNYKTEKIRLFTRGEFIARRKLPNNEFTTRTYEDGRIIASQVAENRRQTQVILNGGMDWYIDKNKTLTFTGIFDREQHTDTSQVPYIDLSTDTRNRFWHWRETEITGYMNYRLDYEHRFKVPGQVLDISAQYTRGWEDEGYFLNDSSAVRVAVDTTHILAIEHVGEFLLDYTRPLANGRLETGAKSRIRRIPVTYTIGQGAQSIIYPNLGDWSDWGENIFAAYGNYILEKPKFDVEAGLRAEYTSVFYDLAPENIYYATNDAYDYFELYPNVRLTLKPNLRNRLSVFYNRRVDRSGEAQLRVFPKFDDPELLKVGNPYLRPQFTQTIELAWKHTWNTGYLFASAYHRIIESPFTRIYAIDTTSGVYDIVNKVYQNAGAGTQSGVEVLFSQEIGKFWQVSANLNAWLNRIDAFEGELLFPYVRAISLPASEEFTWLAKLSNQFSLPKGLALQLSGQYLAPRNIAQGRRRSRASIELGLKKAVWKEKGEISLAATDLLNTYGIREDIVGAGFTARYENRFETQVVRLGFRYKF